MVVFNKTVIVVDFYFHKLKLSGFIQWLAVKIAKKISYKYAT